MSEQTLLEQITAATRKDVEARRGLVPEELLSRHARSRGPGRGFADALADRTSGEPRIIAEIKHASPSRGAIRKDGKVVQLVRELQDNGAAALSVLTEPHYFNGSLRHLRIAADLAVVPVLRKDFVVTTYQVSEARAFGADAVLLIAAALCPEDYRRLKFEADEVGIDVLAEVHNEQELDMVLEHGAEIIGVNSRDLKTFKTDLNVCEQLLARIPDTYVRVAESGIAGADDLARLEAAGAHAFLVGGCLMETAHPGKALRKLLRPFRTGSG